jgi:hypothetical protein
VEWNQSSTGSRAGYTLSLQLNTPVTSLDTGEGQIQIIDTTNWKLRFTPKIGFRGQLQVWVFAYKSGVSSSAQVTIQVGNSVNVIKPALASRALGCVSCHAEVHSSIITDFGAGSPFFFGQTLQTPFRWDRHTPFGDVKNFSSGDNTSTGVDSWAWSTLRLPLSPNNQPQTIFVPAVNIPSGPSRAAGGASTLKAYLEFRLNASTHPPTKQAKVQTLPLIYIGAPTAARLKQAFNWQASDDTSRFKYIKEAPTSKNLSGLVESTNGLYFQNSGHFVCEGDLLVDRPLYLKDMVLSSRTGCRIYSTQPIYVYGSITYLNLLNPDYVKSNLQLTSSRAILFGLGRVWKQVGNQLKHCEESEAVGGNLPAYWAYNLFRSQYTQGMTPSQLHEYDMAIADSARMRLRYWWARPGYFFRADTRPGDVILTELHQQMEATIGPQLDAACEVGGRNKAFERILVNAPLIESRYSGGFKGSIIGEVVLMSLGLQVNNSRFRFEYDPVFDQVPVLPMITEQDFLRVQ